MCYFLFIFVSFVWLLHSNFIVGLSSRHRAKITLQQRNQTCTFLAPLYRKNWAFHNVSRGDTK